MIVKSNKATYNGIEFKSRLELYMYQQLTLAGLSFEYEGESFAILDAFQDDNRLVSKHNKSFIEKGNRRVIGIKYTPDFVVKVNGKIRFIVETKGRPNESFPIRLKLFRWWVNKNNYKWDIFIPTNQKQCDETIKMIQDAIKEE